MGGKPSVPKAPGAPPPPPTPAQIPQVKQTGAPNMGGTYLTAGSSTGVAPVLDSNKGQRKTLLGQ